MPAPSFFIPLPVAFEQAVTQPLKNIIYGVALSSEHPLPPLLIKQINDETKLPGSQRVFVSNVSAIQCEAIAAELDPTGRVFHQAAALAAATNAYHASILLVDCVSQETPGTAYHRVKDSSYVGRHHRCPLEVKSILAVLMTAQFFATSRKQDTHELRIVHWDRAVLSLLWEFYWCNRFFIPKRVSLSFHHVANQQLSAFGDVIVGLGDINEQYAHLIRSMIWLSGATDFEYRDAEPLRPIDVSHLTDDILQSPIVELNLFDVDRTLFNPNVDALLLQKPECQQVDCDMLIEGNAPLIEHLEQSAHLSSWRMAGNFSSRQCKWIDEANEELMLRVPGQDERVLVRVGSCFKVLKDFAHSQDLLFSFFSLTDCMNHLPIGTTYRRLLKSFEQGPHALCPFEKHKILLLLGHVLYTYQVLPPTSRLSVNVFEDDYDILERLSEVFEFHPVFPRDTPINFYHSIGKEVHLYKSIVSKGNVRPMSLKSIPTVAAAASSQIAQFLESIHDPLVVQEDLELYCARPFSLTDETLSSFLDPADLSLAEPEPVRHRDAPAPDEVAQPRRTRPPLAPINLSISRGPGS
ncbi:MAG: hypothetical protein NTW08_07690 [Gammaproteobacteria bacterium]|nr:hypothetical protein [Gammaproteobacteria bacterium]